MKSHASSLAHLVSIALQQSEVAGLSEMLKTIAETNNACGAILWQVVPEADLDREPPTGELSVLGQWFRSGQSHIPQNLPLSGSVTGEAVKRRRSIKVEDVA